MSLLHEPHHDGSPLYLSDEAPALGSRVSVRVRTAKARPYDALWVRSTPDAEPHYDPMIRDHETEHAVWWRGEMTVRNPVQRYRFMLATGDTFDWLNASGVWTHDVPDSHDFLVSTFEPGPDWGRDGVVYQIFPDRFARSAAADEREVPGWARPAEDWAENPIHHGPETPLHYYGGDLDGIVEHLDHLAEVGADIVYTTPVFPGESNHRYNASTFAEVDPLLGGDEALVRLVKAAHGAGFRMLGDLTSNHTGDTHEWFRTAFSDDRSVERGFYFFDDDDTYEGWKGHGTLPKLDHTNPELRSRFAAIVRRWLEQPFDLDGWRIDVANMTGRRAHTDIAHEVARELRRISVESRADALLLAEHGHDASGDLDGDGWHGTMNYYGFSFPVWEWVRRPEGHVPSFGLPVGVPRRTGAEAVAGMREFLGRFGWRAFSHSWNILSSHDSPRIRTVTGSDAMQRVAVGLQFTLPGVPMIFAGDELGLEGVDGEDSRRTIPWATRDTWDTTTLETYAALSRLRREHPALRRGALRWAHIGDDAVAYVREHEAGSVLVLAARDGATGAVELPLDGLPGVPGEPLFRSGGPDGDLHDGVFTVPLDGPGLTLWTLR